MFHKYIYDVKRIRSFKQTLALCQTQASHKPIKPEHSKNNHKRECWSPCMGEHGASVSWCQHSVQAPKKNWQAQLLNKRHFLKEKQTRGRIMIIPDNGKRSHENCLAAYGSSFLTTKQANKQIMQCVGYRLVRDWIFYF